MESTTCIILHRNPGRTHSRQAFGVYNKSFYDTILARKQRMNNVTVTTPAEVNAPPLAPHTAP